MLLYSVRVSGDCSPATHTYLSNFTKYYMSKQIVIIPGGFHPYHAGHYALYQSARKAFPDADLYVAATNSQETRPFPFAVKEKLAKVAGVAPGHFVQVKSPFQAKEITQNYDPEQDILIFVRSEKDRNESPKPGGMKKDGTPAYFQPYTGKDMQPFAKHAYFAYLPTVEFGPGITSATEIRNAWPKLDDRRKTAMVMSLYPATQKNPKLAANVVKMLDIGMGGQENVAKDNLAEEQVTELDVSKTLKFATKAHKGQQYGEKPYITHPRSVAATGKKFFGAAFTPDAIKVALLHDVVEDTPYKLNQLSKMGYTPEVVEAVQLLTKNKALSYADNIKAIIASDNKLAMMVKYADNYQNFTGDKSSWDPERVAHSQKKYLASLDMLGDKLGIKQHLSQPKQQGVAEGKQIWDGTDWGPQGNFAGDTPVNLGGQPVNKLQVGDIVTYFGQKARIEAMSKTGNTSRITIANKMGGITQDVLTRDLKRTGMSEEIGRAGGGFGTNYPGTYEEENGPFTHKGGLKLTSLTTESVDYLDEK